MQGAARLAFFFNRFSQLDPYEFEDMVAEFFRVQGWSNVRTTNRANDKGRDVIGTNPRGEQVYVEVKRHKNTIGRPVIQKLHSIMVADGIASGIVVTTSRFSPKAHEYARKVGVELINGRQFLASCRKLISGRDPDPDYCCPIEPSILRQQAQNSLEGCLFSFPRASSDFIRETHFHPLGYFPVYCFEFSLHQVFSNSTRTWEYTMFYDRELFALFPDGHTSILTRDPFFGAQPLARVEADLTGKGLKVKKKRGPGQPHLHEVKKYIQRATTIRTSYIGQNQQHYTKLLRPSTNRIQIHEERTYWELDTIVDFILDNGAQFNAFFRDDQVSDVQISPVHARRGQQKLSYNAHICQECGAIVEKSPLRRITRYACRECGRVLCEKCLITTRFLKFFKRRWCTGCCPPPGEKRKKNRQILKQLKRRFNRWKKSRQGHPPLYVSP